MDINKQILTTDPKAQLTPRSCQSVNGIVIRTMKSVTASMNTNMCDRSLLLCLLFVGTPHSLEYIIAARTKKLPTTPKMNTTKYIDVTRYRFNILASVFILKSMIPWEVIYNGV